MALQLRVRSTRSCARETSESNHRRNFLSRKERNMLMSREQMARRCTVLRSLAVETGRGLLHSPIMQSMPRIGAASPDFPDTGRVQGHVSLPCTPARVQPRGCILVPNGGRKKESIVVGAEPDNFGALEGSKNGLIAHHNGRQGTALTVPGNARAL